MSLKRILSQAKKELAQFSRDRLTVALALVLPLGMLLIYGYAIRLETKNIPLSIQDSDNSPLSRSYVERLFATNQFIPRPSLEPPRYRRWIGAPPKQPSSFPQPLPQIWQQVTPRYKL